MYKVDKVILFGSLVENKFRKESDIDLALVNINKKEYLQMFNDAYDIASPFKIDLFPLENASDSFKKIILSKGVKL
jgi:predicted nucleotidyltransferase